MILTIVMNLAVNLHDKFMFMTKEIRDEKSFLAQIIEEKRILAVEFQIKKFSIAHGLPENRLSIGLVFAQIPAKLLGNFA